MNVGIRTVAGSSFSGNICFEFSLLCICSDTDGYLVQASWLCGGWVHWRAQSPSAAAAAPRARKLMLEAAAPERPAPPAPARVCHVLPAHVSPAAPPPRHRTAARGKRRPKEDLRVAALLDSTPQLLLELWRRLRLVPGRDGHSCRRRGL